jgi:hypothetical protein
MYSLNFALYLNISLTIYINVSLYIDVYIPYVCLSKVENHLEFNLFFVVLGTLHLLGKCSTT